MDHGRHMLGTDVVLILLARTGAGLAAQPDAPPRLAVHDAAGTLVLSDLVPAMDRYRASGLFAYRLFLGTAFAVGRYQVSFSWASGGTARLRCGVLEIVPGGDAAGAAVSMYSLERPHADHVCQRAASGRRFHRRNPYL